MFKTAKCPHCNTLISNVHFETYEPSYTKGGSLSYVAIAFPCGHSIGVVPVTWEVKIDNIQKVIANQNQALQNMQYQIADMQSKINQIVQYLRSKPL